MNQSALLSKIKTIVRDSDNVRWTEPEMQEAIDDALVDPSFCNLVEADLSVTSEQTYDIPTTIDVVEDVYYVGSTMTRVPSSTWEQISSKIRFRNIPTTGTYTLTGYKQETSDIPAEKTNLAIYLAIVRMYEMLDHKFATGLLMSDITSAEIMNHLDYYNRKADAERSRLGRITNRRGYSI